MPHPLPASSGRSLVIGALGIVYGDIGTSPLYALRECFHETHDLAVTADNVLGILSLIFWSLLVVVTVKYLLFVLYADNDGEGGVLALMALSQRSHAVHPSRGLGILVILGLIGVAFLYSDGMITPAISVLSAVEGLSIATKVFDPYIIPITVAILTAFFVVQRRGSGTIGAVFGPIMLLWFVTMGSLGLGSLARTPEILRAVNPLYGVAFLTHHADLGFIVLGSVFLALTGAEALYADLGHFGRGPIRLSWFSVVLPALLLQYFGQGALLLRDAGALANPFYHLAPGWLLYPLIGLATMATVIASQAMLAGAFSISLQAVQLGYLPPLRITHTSAAQRGQAYVGLLNWILFVGTTTLVLSFQSSSNLAAAYGLAVSGSMIITTLLMYHVVRRVWRWSVPLAALVIAGFLLFDSAFFLANLRKLPHGGWVPVILSLGIFTVMSTWARGRAIVAEHIRAQFPPLERFVKDMTATVTCRVPGRAVFMTKYPDVTPPAFLQNIRHNKVLSEAVYFLTVITEKVPFVTGGTSIEITPIEKNVVRIIARCGFMESPDIRRILRRCTAHGYDIPLQETSFFLSRLGFLATPKPGMALWRERIFVFLSRNTQRASSYFRIPAEQVVEIGLVLEI
ncbi:MAG TPA: potassium transporter Kup [Nitrospiraceae bacterium]|nr:potassium transporter Kup [Nitrospiraceae bacterium]